MTMKKWERFWKGRVKNPKNDLNHVGKMSEDGLSEAGRFKVVSAPLLIEDGWRSRTGRRGKKGAGAEKHRPVASCEVRMRADAFDDAGEKFRAFGHAELYVRVDVDEDGVQGAVWGAIVCEGSDFADAPAAAVDVGLDGRDAVKADTGFG